MEGLRGTGGFPFCTRRAHLLTTRKRAVVWPSATVRSPRGIAAPAGAAERCHSPAGAAVIVHAAGPVMGWQDAISHSRRLPAQTCHRPLCRRDGRVPGLGRAHFLFVKRNKNKPVRRRKGERMAIYHLEAKMVSRGAGR